MGKSDEERLLLLNEAGRIRQQYQTIQGTDERSLEIKAWMTARYDEINFLLSEDENVPLQPTQGKHKLKSSGTKHSIPRSPGLALFLFFFISAGILGLIVAVSNYIGLLKDKHHLDSTISSYEQATDKIIENLSGFDPELGKYYKAKIGNEISEQRLANDKVQSLVWQISMNELKETLPFVGILGGSIAAIVAIVRWQKKARLARENRHLR